MQHNHDLKKLKFDPLTPFPGSARGGGGGAGGEGGLRAKYKLPCCCIHDAFEFDMQQDNILQKLKFDQLTPSPGSGEGGGSTGKIFATMLLRL